MRYGFVNNFAATLASSVTTGDTSIRLESAEATTKLANELVASDKVMLTLITADGATEEIVAAVGESAGDITVTRGQEGTTASAFAVGDAVEARFTAGAANEMAAPPPMQKILIAENRDLQSWNTLEATLPAPGFIYKMYAKLREGSNTVAGVDVATGATVTGPLRSMADDGLNVFLSSGGGLVVLDAGNGYNASTGWPTFTDAYSVAADAGVMAIYEDASTEIVIVDTGTKAELQRVAYTLVGNANSLSLGVSKDGSLVSALADGQLSVFRVSDGAASGVISVLPTNTNAVGSGWRTGSSFVVVTGTDAVMSGEYEPVTVTSFDVDAGAGSVTAGASFELAGDIDDLDQAAIGSNTVYAAASMSVGGKLLVAYDMSSGAEVKRLDVPDPSYGDAVAKISISNGLVFISTWNDFEFTTADKAKVFLLSLSDGSYTRVPYVFDGQSGMGSYPISVVYKGGDIISGAINNWGSHTNAVQVSNPWMKGIKLNGKYGDIEFNGMAAGDVREAKLTSAADGIVGSMSFSVYDVTASPASADIYVIYAPV